MKVLKKRPNGTWSVSFENVHEETGEILPSKTIQSTKDECDVNLIIAKHKKGIATTHLNAKQGVYADLSGAPEYNEALQTIINANNAFETLPASTRKRFGNNPSNLLEFVADPEKNYDEGVKLGLFEQKKPLPATEAPSTTQNINTQNTKQNTQNSNT